MKYFYSASVMNYGDGRWWHKYHNFPNFPRVTKTLTFKPKQGIPFAVLRLGNSVWNRIGLHNMGYFEWLHGEWLAKNRRKDIIVSLAGTDDEIARMLTEIDLFCDELMGIELNFSCPNVKSYENKKVPCTNLMKIHNNRCKLYLKLNYNQDPYAYELDNVAGIRLNAIPWVVGALSGEAAQKKNWRFIQRFNEEGLNVAGCSFTRESDLCRLEEYMGCQEIGIGSIMISDPSLVHTIGSSK